MLFGKNIRGLVSFSKFKWLLNWTKNTSTCNKSLPSALADKLSKGPSLSHFISSNNEELSSSLRADCPPYVRPGTGSGRSVFVETYGCQMNFSDTEVVMSILQNAGFKLAVDYLSADVIFLMTCAIREGAEQKIWNRLHYLKGMKKKGLLKNSESLKVGVLGCMAERLKHKLIEKEQVVDIIAGPDSYKDLPNLLSLADEGQKAVNVILSYDETYADVLPVRINKASKTAFVSIMRGCDNMCTYCIVPFTRGRERSRPVSSILDEIRYLSDQGIKEVTLLGQNVNSYRDLSESSVYFSDTKSSDHSLVPGFSTVYRSRSGGLRFADLLDKVADINPEMRIRFTSPHPKDFPDEVLDAINNHPNICKLLHLPAQSGNSRVLERMWRGHTREAYLDLVDHIREIVPDVALTSDFICGFCDETEDEHQDTLTLMKRVKYEFAYIFPYSMREKTKAHRRFEDNVPPDVKKRRADEAYALFRSITLELHEKEIGKHHLIQVLGPSKRSEDEWCGRNDWNTKVIYPQIEIPADEELESLRLPTAGEYVVVEITECSSQVLKGTPLYVTTLSSYCGNKKKIQNFN